MVNIEEKCEILQHLAACVPENAAGESEDNLLQNFLPLRSYSKLADSRTFLITGGRGAGKTELFRILTSCDGLNFVISDLDKRRYAGLKASQFVVGYIATGPEAKTFPVSNVCSRWVQGKRNEDVYSFWGGIVCISVLKAFSEDQQVFTIAEKCLGRKLTELLQKHSSELSKWWEEVYLREEAYETFLNELDNLLDKRNLQVFLTYDELDKICGNYGDLFIFIRNLLNFWFVHNNRFSNLKAKIFLRSDLYDSKALQFVDSSKMRSYRLELKWDTISLYRMLIKRLVNVGSEITFKYLDSIPGLLQINTNELGYLPGDSEEAVHLFIEKIIGKYMGKTAKRGKSYLWVPNHIQDANGELAPRPFLKCFSFAADEMLKHADEINGLTEDRLLSPTRLQGALAKVSKDRVDELTSEEYHWLQNLIDRLNGKTMLMDKNEFLSYLQPELWPTEKRNELPGRNAEEIMEVLLTLGIVMEAPDHRINVPEIYLYGFGLKRKGGIKRPN